MEKLLVFAIGLTIFGIQGWLSARKNPWLGALLPCLYSIGVVIFFIVSDSPISISNIMPFTLFLTLMLGSWAAGHETKKKKDNMQDA